MNDCVALTMASEANISQQGIHNGLKTRETVHTRKRDELNETICEIARTFTQDFVHNRPGRGDPSILNQVCYARV